MCMRNSVVVCARAYLRACVRACVCMRACICMRACVDVCAGMYDIVCAYLRVRGCVGVAPGWRVFALRDQCAFDPRTPVLTALILSDTVPVSAPVLTWL